MKLYDRLLHHPDILSQSSKAALAQAPLLLLDNVADYVAVHKPEGVNPLTDTPNLAPPFRSYFMDYRFPSAIWNRNVHTLRWMVQTLTSEQERLAQQITEFESRPVTRVGIWFEATELQEMPAQTSITLGQRLNFLIAQSEAARLGISLTKDSVPLLARTSALVAQALRALSLPVMCGDVPDEAALPRITAFLQQLDAPTRTTLLDYLTYLELQNLIETGRVNRTLIHERLAAACKWVLSARIYFEKLINRRVYTIHVETMRYHVDPQGHLPKAPNGSPFLHTHSPLFQQLQNAYGPSPLTNHHNGLAQDELFVAFLGTSFLHCKNVALVRETPDPHLRKRAHERQRHPTADYHVLDIRPMQQVLRTEGQIDSHGLKQALHICRGHFKDYREHRLFGKHKGLYWWNQQLRGSAEVGTIDKDYRLHPPTAPASAPLSDRGASPWT